MAMLNNQMVILAGFVHDFTTLAWSTELFKETPTGNRGVFTHPKKRGFLQIFPPTADLSEKQPGQGAG